MTVTIDTIRHVLRALAQVQRHPHKARAFQNAAKALEGLTLEDLRAMSPKQILALPGVGNSSYRVIMELLETGRSTRYEQEVGLPVGCDLLQLRGVGVKTAQKIIQQYGVTTVAQLEEAVRRGRVTDPRLVQAVTQWARYKERLPWYKAHGVVRFLKERLADLAYLIPCGSYRRLRATVADLDFIVPLGTATAIRRALKGHWREESAGPRKIGGTLDVDGYALHVDFLEVPERELWAAVNYLTGSKKFNILLRTLAKRRGYKINEKCVVDRRGREIYLESEEHLFDLLGLPYVPPEAREDGTKEELERAPDWRRVKPADFHVHTRLSDGDDAPGVLAEMFDGRVRGVADHSRPHPSGVKNRRAYARLVRGFGLLAGLEVEILAHGRPPIDPRHLARDLDYVVLSAHYKREAILKIEPVVKELVARGVPVILGHLSGRRVGHRDGVPEADLIALLDRLAPYRHQVIVEVNAQPDRLDPPYRVLRHATALGYGVVVSSDYHRGGRRYHLWLHHLGQRRALRGLVRKEHLKRAWRVLKKKA